MIIKQIKRQLPLVIFLVIYLLFVFFSYKDYGITYDEQRTYWRGKQLYNEVTTNNEKLQKNFVLKNETNDETLLIYPSYYSALLYSLNKKENFQTYHLLNFLFALIIFISIYQGLLVVFKKPLLAILGPIFLITSPRFFGHIAANPKDIPFAIMYFLSLVMIYFSSHWKNIERVLFLGILFGLTVSLRFVGYSIILVYLFYKLFLEESNKTLCEKTWMAFFEVIVIFLISFLVNIITLPYLGVNPLDNFIKLFLSAKQYPWNGDVLFIGKRYWLENDKLPWYYLPVWILFTTPIYILVLFIVGSFNSFKNNLSKIVLASLIINLAIYFITKPVVYDGFRHMLYLLPQIVLLAVCGYIYLGPKVKKYARFLILVNIILILISYIQLHPYQYIYFNELIGGLKGAYGQLEIDYWMASNKEAALWLKNNIAKKTKKNIKVAICGNIFSASYFFSRNMKVVYHENEADYVICNERSDYYKKINGEIVYTVKREGVNLGYVFKTK